MSQIVLHKSWQLFENTLAVLKVMSSFKDDINATTLKNIFNTYNVYIDITAI